MKKGQTHIEVVIATTIFLISVTLLLFYLNPVRESTSSTTILSVVESSFKEQVYVNLTRIFVKNTERKDCLSIDLSSLNINGNSYAEESTTKNPADSQFAGNTLNLGPNYYSFNVFISEDIDSKSASCPPSPQVYELGSVNTIKIISLKKLEQIKSDYESNYEQLKEKMNIPPYADFSVSSDVITMEKTIPEKVEVQSKKIREDVLYNTGKIESEEFIIKTW